jgi:ParB-like chromosome segregation protein Spo0J
MRSWSIAAVLSADVSFVSPDALRPFPGNPRVHPESQIEALAKSMAQLGWSEPIICDEHYVILAGHGRVAAAQRLYARGERAPNVPAGMVPVVVKRGLSEDDKRAYVVTDNRLASISLFDVETLAGELAELQVGGIPASAMGFSAEDLTRISEDAMRNRLDAMGAVEDADTEDDNFSEPSYTDDNVLFKALIPAAQRGVVYAALEEAKERYQAETTGDALVALLIAAGGTQ